MSSGVLSCHKYLETIQAFLSPTPHIQQTLRGLGMVLQGEVHHWPTVGFVSGGHMGPTWVAHHKCTPPNATLSTQTIEKKYTRHVNGNWCWPICGMRVPSDYHIVNGVVSMTWLHPMHKEWIAFRKYKCITVLVITVLRHPDCYNNYIYALVFVFSNFFWSVRHRRSVTQLSLPFFFLFSFSFYLCCTA